jgi:glucose/arabinose dehydrogenase
MQKYLIPAAALILLAGAALAQQAGTPPANAPARAPIPAQQTYEKTCQGCHGTDLAGGRGPSLFSETLLNENSDAQLHDIIVNGTQNGMPSFKGQLDDATIYSVLAYLRIRSGTMSQLPAFVPDPQNVTLKTQKQTVKLEVVASGIDTPWGETFLPYGRMLVTERSGHIRIIDKSGHLLPDPVKNTPTPWVRQDGGFFDIAISPDYKRDGWIYLSYSEVMPGYTGALPPANAARPAAGAPPIPNPPSMTRIVRAHLNARDEWVDQQDIFKADNSFYTTTVIHYGSRFLFDGKGHLFFSLGERGDQTNAQRLDTPLGKIHRVNLDGSIPADNPFVGTPGAVKSIWTYGHRNPEGLSFNPVTGDLWESEHGPTGGDEINIIQKGHNYGWGVVSMGLQPGIDHQHEPGMDDPVRYFTPSIGPSGITFLKGNKYPGWKNNLFLSALVGMRLYRFETSGQTVSHDEVIWDQFGRTRDVIEGPDGLLYVLIQNPTGRGTNVGMAAATPGAVVRLVPQGN